MSIYFKDKDLDKSKYKSSDLDQLQNYIKNYMKDDPRQLSEEEKQQLYKQAEEELKKLQTQEKGSQQKQQLQQNDNEVKGLNPDRMKQIFDRMVEIDTDPQGKKAQDYYKKLEEIERSNPNKKKSEIIIKTMKKGRTIKQEKYSIGIGQNLTEEEIKFEKKFIDYKAFTFPEMNPVTITAKSKGKEVKLANYRYPAQTKDRKGIIFYVHGYGDYCQRYAYLAKQFAEAGYDFVGMDQKGFGNSEGQRAIIDSEQSLIEEHLNYFDAVDSKFGGKDVSKLMLGVSMGGLVASSLSIQRPNWFKGMGLIAPYFEMKNRQLLDKYLGVAKFIDKFYPSYRIADFPAAKRSVPAKYQSYIKDPLLEYQKIPVHNILVNDDAIKKFNQQQDQVNTPLIMILGGQDNVICNKTAKQFFEVCPISDKDIITYEDADHFMIMDNEFMPLVVKDLIGWFNTHS